MAANKKLGACDWVFPDGDLPPAGDQDPPGHESLVIVNLGERPAQVELTFLFEDRAPVQDVGFEIGAQRVRCIRMDQPIGESEYRVPFGQYALHVRSSAPVVCQLGRMDRRAPDIAYYTVMGYPLGD